MPVLPPKNASSSRIRIVIENGLLDPYSDADRHQNVTISWSLGHTQTLHKISSKAVGNSIIQWIRISYFGLLDLNGDPDRHQYWTHWSLGHILPLQEISSKSVHNFFSYPTDRQTNRQTDRTKNITSFNGGKNATHIVTWTLYRLEHWIMRYLQ